MCASVFEFEETFRAAESSRLVCIGPKRTISAIVSQSELVKLFGGWILYEDDSRGEEYLGVWGSRKIKTFRRVLRERGAVLKIERWRPLGLRPKIRHVQYVES